MFIAFCSTMPYTGSEGKQNGRQIPVTWNSWW